MAPLNTKSKAKTLDDYSKLSGQTDRLQQNEQEFEMLLYGIYGEIGSLLSAIKKVKRDSLSQKEARISGEELGDALWYLFALARAFKIQPSTIGNKCLEILGGRKNGISPTFRVIHAQIEADPAKHDVNDRSSVIKKMISSVNKVMEIKPSTQTNDRADILAEALSQLAITSASLELTIEDVAEENLTKNASRWPSENDRNYIPLFDESYPENERFSRSFEMVFEERTVNNKVYCFITMNGVNIGDRLTDNNHQKDDYKFHDVFHLAYLTHLGWSPVLRALLKVKRKSNPATDENEDGARAIIIEEGISTWIFNHARDGENNFYDNVEVGKLEYSLLKQVANLVKGCEVEKCPLWQWEMAILDGFKMYRSLVQHRAGTIKVDLNNRTITFTKHGQPI